MKKNIFLLVLLLTFVFFAFTVCCSVLRYGGVFFSAIWRPRIVCEEPLYDFGSVSDSKPDHEFVILNKGGRELLVQNVRAGCGSCIEVVDFTKEPIAPKNSGTVKLALLANLLEGKVSKETVVKSNDPKNPSIILTLEAEIIAKQNETIPNPKNVSDKTESKDDGLNVP
jgi:hypothetical protein